MTELERLECYAAQGDVQSQFQLGMKYVEAKVIGKDDAKGIAWLEKAAEQGAAFASSTLSMIYIGRGDVTTGIKWLQRAAEQGLANSQGQLGLFYSMDKLIPQDDVMAGVWMTVAVANDCPGGDDSLQEVLSRLNASQKAEVQKLAAELIARLPRIPFREHAERVGLM